uniref:Uncharacterized protein n=1 Tax=Strigops habroptila TaxID=2489341 RepID=A0A672TXU4_STRHB
MESLGTWGPGWTGRCKATPLRPGAWRGPTCWGCQPGRWRRWVCGAWGTRSYCWRLWSSSVPW